MKPLLNAFLLLSMGAFMLALNSCKTNSMIHCPDLASTKKPRQPIFASLHHHNQSKTSKDAVQASIATPVAQANIATPAAPAVASTDQSMPLKFRMPSALAKNLQNDQDLDDMNKLLAGYSNNSMMLQRNDKGKLFLKAHSVKDIFALAKSLGHPQGYYERRYGSEGGPGTTAGAAIASSVLGPIGFIFAFIPFLSFAAIPISIAAIITGGIGLRSPRSRLATIGLTFGILGLIFSILMSILYLHIFFAFFI